MYIHLHLHLHLHTRSPPPAGPLQRPEPGERPVAEQAVQLLDYY